MVSWTDILTIWLASFVLLGYAMLGVPYLTPLAAILSGLFFFIAWRETFEKP
jgi:hypothetical protein